jgi:site-specific DNA-methyltransferase (adenine-specific)
MMAAGSLFARAVDPFACMDAVEWLRTHDDETVDLIVTDPAYESLEKHRKIGTTTRLKQSKASSNEWFPIFPNTRFPEFFRECYRVLKRNSHLYVLCDEETMWVARPIGEAAGFRYWKSLTWDKGSIGMGYHWRNRTERVMFFEKGKRKLNNLGLGDVIEEPDLLEPWMDDVIHAPRIRAGYPTEKPAKLPRVLIENSSAPGELVIDPFMGSGSTGEAAVRAGRRFTGCDIKQSAVDIARGRVMGAAA